MVTKTKTPKKTKAPVSQVEYENPEVASFAANIVFTEEEEAQVDQTVAQIIEEIDGSVEAGQDFQARSASETLNKVLDASSEKAKILEELTATTTQLTEGISLGDIKNNESISSSQKALNELTDVVGKARERNGLASAKLFEPDSWLDALVSHMPWAPDGIKKKLRDIASNTKSAEERIQQILEVLQAELDGNEEKMERLRSMSKSLKALGRELKKEVEILNRLKTAMAEKVEEIRERDPVRASAVEGLLLRRILQREMDVRSMILNTQINKTITDRLLESQLDLRDATERTSRIGLVQLRTSLAAAIALADQKLTAEMLKKINESMMAQMEGTVSETVRHQREMALLQNTPLAELSRLAKAFDDLEASAAEVAQIRAKQEEEIKGHLRKLKEIEDRQDKREKDREVAGQTLKDVATAAKDKKAANPDPGPKTPGDKNKN